MERATIRELSEAVIGELERLGYASETIKSYQRLYQKFIRYADERQIQHHSPDMCHRWLRDSIGIDPTLVTRRNEHVYKRNSYLPIRVCQCLTEWQLHGCLALKKQGKLAALELPRQFKEADPTGRRTGARCPGLRSFVAKILCKVTGGIIVTWNEAVRVTLHK